MKSTVYKALLRQRPDAVFQTRDIREACGWNEESVEGRRMHAIIQSLKNEGVLRQDGPPRKRHQYLVVAKPDTLRARLGRIKEHAGTGNGKVEEVAAAVSGPQRVRYLEDRLADLEGRAVDQEDTLAAILASISTLSAKTDVLTRKVDEIHREWVTA
ncbi:MAG: hypothetical protein H0U46_06480 [Actinobacteria bacterium]|nr:hypothetical protein [Actinomycetota bacterium]